MQKNKRQQRLKEIVESTRVTNQAELLEALERAGVSTNQATVSRDLNELGIVKFKGVYNLPQAGAGYAQRDLLTVEAAGDHLLVAKTPPGKAMSLGFYLDNLKLESIVGTIAGDDTVFIAVKSKHDHHELIKNLMENF